MITHSRKQEKYPVEEIIQKNKVIVFNQEHKILVLDGGKNIKLPKDMKSSKGYSIQILQSLFLLDPDKKVDLLTKTFYYQIFKEENNKLKKVNRKIIQEYYAYYMEFLPEQIDRIWNSQILMKEERIPYLLEMKQFLKLKTPYVSEEDKEAVKILEKKLNYEK